MSVQIYIDAFDDDFLTYGESRVMVTSFQDGNRTILKTVKVDRTEDRLTLSVDPTPSLNLPSLKLPMTPLIRVETLPKNLPPYLQVSESFTASRISPMSSYPCGGLPLVSPVGASCSSIQLLDVDSSVEIVGNAARKEVIIVAARDSLPPDHEEPGWCRAVGYSLPANYYVQQVEKRFGVSLKAKIDTWSQLNLPLRRLDAITGMAGFLEHLWFYREIAKLSDDDIRLLSYINTDSSWAMQAMRYASRVQRTGRLQYVPSSFSWRQFMSDVSDEPLVLQAVSPWSDFEYYRQFFVNALSMDGNTRPRFFSRAFGVMEQCYPRGQWLHLPTTQPLVESCLPLETWRAYLVSEGIPFDTNRMMPCELIDITLVPSCSSQFSNTTVTYPGLFSVVSETDDVDDHHVWEVKSQIDNTDEFELPDCTLVTVLKGMDSIRLPYDMALSMSDGVKMWIGNSTSYVGTPNHSFSIRDCSFVSGAVGFPHMFSNVVISGQPGWEFFLCLSTLGCDIVNVFSTALGWNISHHPLCLPRSRGCATSLCGSTVGLFFRSRLSSCPSPPCPVMPLRGGPTSFVSWCVFGDEGKKESPDRHFVWDARTIGDVRAPYLDMSGSIGECVSRVLPYEVGKVAF